MERYTTEGKRTFRSGQKVWIVGTDEFGNPEPRWVPVEDTSPWDVVYLSASSAMREVKGSLEHEEHCPSCGRSKPDRGPPGPSIVEVAERMSSGRPASKTMVWRLEPMGPEKWTPVHAPVEETHPNEATFPSRAAALRVLKDYYKRKLHATVTRKASASQELTNEAIFDVAYDIMVYDMQSHLNQDGTVDEDSVIQAVARSFDVPASKIRELRWVVADAIKEYHLDYDHSPGRVGASMVETSRIGSPFHSIDPDLVSQGVQDPTTGEWTRSTKVQTLLVDRDEFSKSAAKSWARSHGFRYGKVHGTPGYWRIRQADPTRFVPGTFRTKEIRDGVKIVFGIPKGE